ncbi:MAG: TetR/AcrR family transcriptional regulator [Myxococcales bacterium]|nr:MAG: TetR/AcrR family transcriptional regulator [Myxococcales bacterium]
MNECSDFINSGFQSPSAMPGSPSKRPRRKAKQERSRQTVRALLEAAARVLEVHGYAAATTNRIAESAGASVGTRYEHFPNK